jgi:glycosyltransferase involved in cell wall biosynthesis|tara:strand:+ start:426 stop:1487 length:1062 start_codon:yes stop_codon:yes gene_type:complete
MKILHICQNFNNTLYKDLFNELYSFGITQTVFYPYIYPNGPIHNNNNNNINVVAKKSVPPIFRHFFVIRAFFNFYNLKRSVKINEFDIIHCHTLFNDGIVGLIISMLYKKKLVITIRQSDIDIYKKKIWLRPYVSLFKFKKSRFISLSPAIKKHFSQLQPQVIGNGIKDAFFKASSIDKNKNKIELIYIGRIIKRKNLDIVIRLIEKYKEKYNLKVIGTPSTNSQWSKEILFKLNSLSNIEFFPNLSTNEIITHLDQSHIFILPSINETFGIVYLEAMSRGIPVVYMKGTAIDGLFEKEVGRALNSHDSSYINDNLDYILQNYLTISNNCEAYSKEYNWLSIANKTTKIYNEA